MSISDQLVLLLCFCCVQAQDFMSPNVNIFNELGKIKHLQERLKTTEGVMQSLKNELNELSLTLEFMNDENEDLMVRVQRLQNENEALKTTVQTLQKENEVRKVGFSASLLDSGKGHTSPLSPVRLPLIYKKVFTNVGNGYDANTGTFTAPVKGIYFFRFYTHSDGDTKSRVSLFKNGEEKPVGNDSSSNWVVLTLEKGDRVFTKLRPKTWFYNNSISQSSFEGFLLFPL